MIVIIIFNLCCIIYLFVCFLCGAWKGEGGGGKLLMCWNHCNPITSTHKSPISYTVVQEETIVDVELTILQKKYYRAIFERNRAFLGHGTSGKGKGVAKLINIEMELRKCCNHPYLIDGVEAKETASLLPAGSDPHDDYQRATKLIGASGKTVLLDKLLPKLKAEGHKVLIFSQFVIMLDLLEDLLQLRGYGYERIDGSVRGNERGNAIDRFNAQGIDSRNLTGESLARERKTHKRAGEGEGIASNSPFPSIPSIFMD